MNGQLIIKAPNQNITDHIVNCNLNWTVEQLKQHLHSSYPNNPTVQEQKLIYSGHLLQDNVQLKDILRVEDDQPAVYILHLVCKEQVTTSQQQLQVNQTWNSQLQQPLPSTSSSTESAPENNLRHRNNAVNSNVYPQFQQQVTGQNNAMFMNNPQAYAQMAMMQQMYSYYFTQYMQNVSSTAATENNPPLPNTTNQQSPPPAASPVIPQRVHNRGNPPRAHNHNEDHPRRDWLDHLFAGCRFIAFFCFLFFYSTPERLMIVIVCAVIAFLYHEGWFVRRGNQQPAAEAAQEDRYNDNNAQNNENSQSSSNAESSDNEELDNVHELEAAMDGDDPPHVQGANSPRNNNPVFSPLNFLSSFFSSLIPEPPPPINMN